LDEGRRDRFSFPPPPAPPLQAESSPQEPPRPPLPTSTQRLSPRLHLWSRSYQYTAQTPRCFHFPGVALVAYLDQLLRFHLKSPPIFFFPPSTPNSYPGELGRALPQPLSPFVHNFPLLLYDRRPFIRPISFLTPSFAYFFWLVLRCDLIVQIGRAHRLPLQSRSFLADRPLASVLYLPLSFVTYAVSVPPCGRSIPSPSSRGENYPVFIFFPTFRTPFEPIFFFYSVSTPFPFPGSVPRWRLRPSWKDSIL